ISISIVCCMALTTLPPVAVAQDAPPRLSVPAKELPVPDTVSPELQKRLTKPVPPIPTMPTTAEGWKKMQHEADAAAEITAHGVAEKLGPKVEAVEIAGVKCFQVTPEEIAPEKKNDLLVHVHGGAYVFNGGIAATSEAILLADACKMPALSIDYRMPPD